MAQLIEAAKAALEALENCNSEHGHRCNRCDSEVDEGGKVAAALRTALAAAEKPAEPAHWLAVLDAEQRPHQLKTGLHDVGFHKKRSAEEFIASELTFNGWVYTLQPLFAVAPAQPASPAAPAQAPLTDEQVFTSEDFMTANGLYWGLPITTLMQIVRCTERAHGIGDKC